MNRIRQEQIKKYVESKGVATVKELHALFPGVSLMTLHRDLSALEEMGIITKYRGGVRSVHQLDDIEFHIRMKENAAGKASMVKKAIRLLHPKSSVFLDAGTSSVMLARHLPDIDLNITTISPHVALELCRLKNVTVNLCGGTMNPRTLSVSGIHTLEHLEGINIDLAFIGVSGCSCEVGFTCGTEADMLTKRLVIQKARTSVALCTSDKLRRLMPFTFAAIGDVDYIISDEPLPFDFLRECEGGGARIL